MNDFRQFPSADSRAQDGLICSVAAAEDMPELLKIESKKKFEQFRLKHADAYDGQLAGLRKVERGAGGLALGFVPVSFSWYLATRDLQLRPDWPRADPMGTTSIVRSSDGHVLVSVRSLLADQNPGALYFVGGFVEISPDGQVDVFGNALREVAEETGLDVRGVVAATRLIGIDYDPEFPHPEAFFEIRLTLSAQATLAHLRSFQHEEVARFSVVSYFEFLSLGAADAPLTWSFRTGRQFLTSIEAAGT
jgi:8-oxo-dGTP pyrophosphatase MutT (NUDIX family)